MLIRKPYAARKRSGTSFDGQQTMTEQSHKKSCDINNILRKFAETQTISHVNSYEAHYNDVPADDLLQAMLITKNAETMFQSLPSELRNEFNNNAVSFLEFVQNPENEAELVKKGLATKKETTPTVEQLVEVETKRQLDAMATDEKSKTVPEK